MPPNDVAPPVRLERDTIVLLSRIVPSDIVLCFCDLDRARAFVQTDDDDKERDYKGTGQTLCMHAAARGYIGLLRACLEHDPAWQVTVRDNQGMTALMHASGAIQVECMEALLEHDPDVQVTAQDEQGMTALSRVASLSWTLWEFVEDAMRALLKHEPDTQLVLAANDGLIPLMRVAAGRNSIAADLLLEQSAEAQLRATDANGRTTLMRTINDPDADEDCTCFGGTTCFARRLLRVIPEEQAMAADEEGMTALLLAVRAASRCTVDALLEHNPVAQLTAVDVVGMTALVHSSMDSVSDADVDVMDLLLRHEPALQVLAANVAAVRRPPLFNVMRHLVRGCALRRVALLLRHEPEVQVVTAVDGVNALLMAVTVVRHMEELAGVVSELLKHEPCRQVVAQRSRDGAFPLLALLERSDPGGVGVARLLLEHDPVAQVVAADNHKTTALMAAASKGDDKTVGLLLQHTPDGLVDVVDLDNRTALSLACAGKHDACMRLLIAQGARPRPADEAAWAVVRGVAQEALVPGAANEAVVGLAQAANDAKRRRVGGGGLTTTGGSRSRLPAAYS